MFLFVRSGAQGLGFRAVKGVGIRAIREIGSLHSLVHLFKGLQRGSRSLCSRVRFGVYGFRCRI